MHHAMRRALTTPATPLTDAEPPCVFESHTALKSSAEGECAAKCSSVLEGRPSNMFTLWTCTAKHWCRKKFLILIRVGTVT
eukprot:10501337-Alexandrium_andersonii.AAC.1